MRVDPMKNEQPMADDLTRLQEVVVARFSGNVHSIHGIAHWRHVEQNGIEIARQTGADMLVVRLFAWLHDSRRRNDDEDEGHGERAAAWLTKLHGHYFTLDAERLATLRYACRWHTDQIATDDVTIGACWDADRLDLTRIGVLPDEEYLNTEHGKVLSRRIIQAQRSLQ